MKQLTKLSYLLITFFIVFSCDNQTDDTSVNPTQSSEHNRSIDEITSLIQADPLTAIHRSRMTNMFSNSNPQLEAAGPVAVGPAGFATKQEAMNYYNSMLANYPELQDLPVEKQVEVIYNVKLDQLETQARTYESAYSANGASGSPELSEAGSGSGGNIDCSPILGLALVVWEVELILSEAGLSELSATVGAITTLLLGAYNLCVDLSN